MTVSTVAYRTLQLKNNETLQDAFVYDDKSKSWKSTLSGSSADLFTAKTNKYAESGLVILVATAAMHFKFGAAGVSAATTSDYYLPANTRLLCAVDTSKPYLRAIGTGDIYAVEVF